MISMALLQSRFYLLGYSGCKNNVPIVGRYFVKTPFAAILFFGKLL
jgi:hypothetical protein